MDSLLRLPVGGISPTDSLLRLPVGGKYPLLIAYFPLLVGGNIPY